MNHIEYMQIRKRVEEKIGRTLSDRRKDWKVALEELENRIEDEQDQFDDSL